MTVYFFPEARETQLGYSLSFKDFKKLDDSRRQYLFQDFISQSNQIEGIKGYEIETYSEGDKIPPPSANIINHERALDFVLDKVSGKTFPSKRKIRSLHRILMQDLLPKQETGKFRKKELVISKRYIVSGEKEDYFYCKIIRNCPLSKYIDYLMRRYVVETSEIISETTSSEEELFRNHAYFEWIHPFADGNGRTGRLLFNWISLLTQKSFFVFQSSKREQYYAFLKESEAGLNKKHPRISKRSN